MRKRGGMCSVLDSSSAAAAERWRLRRAEEWKLASIIRHAISRRLAAASTNDHHSRYLKRKITNGVSSFSCKKMKLEKKRRNLPKMDVNDLEVYFKKIGFKLRGNKAGSCVKNHECRKWMNETLESARQKCIYAPRKEVKSFRRVTFRPLLDGVSLVVYRLHVSGDWVRRSGPFTVESGSCKCRHHVSCYI